MPLQQPMPVLVVGEPIVLGFAPIQGKPVAQLAGADARHFAKGVALTGSMRLHSGNGPWHERGEH
jgi:antitoxin (DNA-binding transcriptional repressor) of toxin-antitoxin stability system